MNAEMTASPGITRRQLLDRAAGGGTLLLAGSPLLSACGGSSPSAGTANPTRGGTLRFGVLGGSSADTLDANAGIIYPDFARAAALYDGLVAYGPGLEYEYVLAESIEPNATATQWTVRLRPGVRFHDGRPLTADDVIFTLNRILAGKLYGSIGLTGVTSSGLRKRDPRTLQIDLEQPSTVLLPQLASIYSLIVPVGYDPEHPIGTGAFKLESFVPGQQSTFVRNPHYFREGQPYLDRLIITDFADATARLNALLGGQVDIIDQVPAPQVASISGAAGFRVVNTATSSFTPFTMRVDKVPFDDVRVRQAMRLAVDRPQMVEQAMSGYATLGNDVFSKGFSDYDGSLPQRHQDIEQARALLRQAGQSDLSIRLVTSDVAAGLTQAAQVLAQQVTSSGIRVQVDKVTPSEFYGSNYLSWIFAQDAWFAFDYLLQVAYSMLPASPFNETHWQNEEYAKLYAEANRTVDQAQRREIIASMQMMDYQQGGYVIPYYVNIVDAFANSVGGYDKGSKTGIPLNGYNFANLWVA